MRKTPLSFVFAALLLDCAHLDAIPVGTCGNGVVDATEDCDSFPASCGTPVDGARACRFTCDRTKADACPVGWGCSVEGFCRQATGGFESAGVPSSAGVVTLLTGDFDGDGRADLVGAGPRGGSTKPRIHFYDSNAVPSAPTAIDVPMASPVVRDFDGDGRDDLAFTVNDSRFGGFGLLSGTADRAFGPVLFPTITKPATDVRFVAIPADPRSALFTPLGQGALVTVERDAGGTWFRTVSTANLIGLAELEQPAPMGPEAVVGAPVRGRLFAPDAFPTPSTCGEVVFPYNTGSGGRLVILSPCRGTPTVTGQIDNVAWEPRTPKDVPVCFARGGNPCVPATITGKVLIAEVDPPTLFVDTSEGTLRATSNGTALSRFELQRETDGTNSDTPLAVGDLAGNGSLSVVLPTAAFVARSNVDGGAVPDAGLDPDAAATPGTGRWSDARIGNFNADVLPDLVALSAGSLEIEFFANAGYGLFSRFSIPSSQPVRAMTTGDFDGDRILDVAFLASSRALGTGDTTSSADIEILVAYGQARGGPEPARLVGRFRHAVGLTALHHVDRAIDDLIVAEATPQPVTSGAAASSLPSTSMTLIRSSGDRQALAPLLFEGSAAREPPKAGQIRVWLPTTILAAPFSAPGSIDVMALASGVTVRADRTPQSRDFFVLPFPTGAWFAQADRNAVGGLQDFKEVFRFDASDVNALNDKAFVDNGVLENLLISAAADVDSPPDGVAEVVSLSRGRANGSDLLVVHLPDLVNGKEPTTVALGDFAVRGDDELALLDMSADGLPDAVVLARTPRDGVLLPGEARNREAVRVYLNDGKGAFDPTPIRFEIPPSSGTADPPLAFARVMTGAGANGKPRFDLAVVTRRRLFLGHLEASKSFAVRDLTGLLGSPLSERLSAVASGDFDGDGVPDLAVADSGAIRLLRQIPRLR